MIQRNLIAQYRRWRKIKPFHVCTLLSSVWSINYIYLAFVHAQKNVWEDINQAVSKLTVVTLGCGISSDFVCVCGCVCLLAISFPSVLLECVTWAYITSVVLILLIIKVKKLKKSTNPLRSRLPLTCPHFYLEMISPHSSLPVIFLCLSFMHYNFVMCTFILW